MTTGIKSTLFAALLAVAALLVSPLVPDAAGVGNSAESGAHYNLNIIGTNDKSADMDNNDGHRIFVHLDGSTRISLVEGPEFAVLDANGTDDDDASFQLPADGYSIYLRPLGKPGGSATMATCADVFAADDWKLVDYRKSEVNPDGLCSLSYVGPEDELCYFWEYGNSGLRLAQLRFYPHSS